MKRSLRRSKKNAIRWIDGRNISKRADQWKREMDAYFASQTRHIGASTVRRRDSDPVDINISICDLEPIMSKHFEPQPGLEVKDRDFQNVWIGEEQ